MASVEVRRFVPTFNDRNDACRERKVGCIEDRANGFLSRALRDRMATLLYIWMLWQLAESFGLEIQE
jgi:hypothetical protein